ncbi:MAG: hypothetical protein NZ602_06565 [Thermoguttaceae bacterium]|nr:hypothetical protein [Thermoguttaceae bacterium]MDW8036944.1 hypothetical protein [Thermoguttaceae bacterium]
MNLMMLILYLGVGPFLLRLVVYVYNSLREDPASGIPEPSLGKAFGMMAAVTVADFLIRIILLAMFAGVEGNAPAMMGITMVVYFVLIFLSMVGIFALVLPTRLGPAVVIAIMILLSYVFIGFLIQQIVQSAATASYRV